MPSSIRIGNQDLAADVSSLGAEMQALVTNDGRSWLWTGDAAFWTGRSPILFPIVGKAPDDTVAIDGTLYPMGQHGFARRSEFALAASTPTMCRHELAASAATRAVYPFDFLLAVEHAVEGRMLTVTAEVAVVTQRRCRSVSGFTRPSPGRCRAVPAAPTPFRSTIMASRRSSGWEAVSSTPRCCPRPSTAGGWCWIRQCSTRMR